MSGYKTGVSPVNHGGNKRSTVDCSDRWIVNGKWEVRHVARNARGCGNLGDKDEEDDGRDMSVGMKDVTGEDDEEADVDGEEEADGEEEEEDVRCGSR